jgi:hypothetical protein
MDYYIPNIFFVRLPMPINLPSPLKTSPGPNKNQRTFDQPPGCGLDSGFFIFKYKNTSEP